MSAPLRRRLFGLARSASRSLPPAVREVALALGARAVGGPALLPGPPPGPVLVLAPHPDDETIGCGGALARHADRGDRTAVVVATSGEATSGGRGDVAARREDEVRAACAALGVAAPALLRLPDGGLAGATDALADALRRFGADAAVVYAPSLLDPHPDHIAANVALAAAGLGADVYGYEVWSPGPVDVLLDVTGVHARKEAALRCYPTALDAVDYVRAATGLAMYRSAGGGLGGRGFAEGFLRLGAEEHRLLVGRLGPDGAGGGVSR